MAQKPCKGNDFFFKLDFWEVLSVYDKTNEIFWKTETQLDKVGMFLKHFDFQNLTFLTWTWPVLRSNVKMSVAIEFYAQNDP